MRSPWLLSVEESLLVLVDLQEKLLAALASRERLLSRCRLLVDSAITLGVPVVITEQYPRGLGRTDPSLLPGNHRPHEKQAFSCCDDEALSARIAEWGRRQVVLAGIEAHVCVLQTALDLVADGYHVYVAVDAVASRRAIDQETALRRLEHEGIRATTAESAVFEWTRIAGTPQFKAISERIKSADREAF